MAEDIKEPSGPHVGDEPSNALSPGQQWKQAQFAKQKEEQDKKLAAVLKQVAADAEAYKKDVIGSWIPYTDKNGIVCPSMVIGTSFKTIDNVLKVAVIVWVHSASTSQPYRAEILY
jgi:hypothetical protein